MCSVSCVCVCEYCRNPDQYDAGEMPDEAEWYAASGCSFPPPDEWSQSTCKGTLKRAHVYKHVTFYFSLFDFSLVQICSFQYCNQ